MDFPIQIGWVLRLHWTNFPGCRYRYTPPTTNSLPAAKMMVCKTSLSRLAAIGILILAGYNPYTLEVQPTIQNTGNPNFA